MHDPWTILGYFVDNLDPFIFKIGSWGPRWYGLAYLLGFLFAYLLIKKNARDGMLRLNPERVSDLVLNACIFGVLVGGRLGYCLFYQPKLLWFTSEFPYWGVLRVWEGGMSAHGGIVFTILTLMWFGWKYRKQGASIVNIGDAACMVVPIGLFFGRCATANCTGIRRRSLGPSNFPPRSTRRPTA
jgi:phosphatidylglycerol:prolipoprotein diacylglycerol transferase